MRLFIVAVPVTERLLKVPEVDCAKAQDIMPMNIAAPSEKMVFMRGRRLGKITGNTVLFPLLNSLGELPCP